MINSRKITDLHSVVRDLCYRHLDASKARGVELLVTSTLRDAEYQAYLYSLGRTREGSIVTNMKLIGPHAFGLAYDVVPLVNGKAMWDNDSLWTIAGEEGKKLGLTWGGDWGSLIDKPHFEYTGGLTSTQLRSGQRPVWWEVVKLDWKEILKNVADSPESWEKAINTVVAVTQADGNLGDLEIMQYLPELIEKVYNNRG